MGYIFDAMERADAGGDPPDRPQGSAGPDAPDAAPRETAVSAVPCAAEASVSIPPSDGAAASSSPLAADTSPGPLDAAQSFLFPHADNEPSNHNAPSTSQPTALDDRLVAQTDPASIPAEQYRSIRTGLLARWQNKRHLIHTITSATPQEGKTITSLNLGLCLSELHTRSTVVLEADLRLPQFAELLHLPESPGLVNLLEGEATLSDVLHSVGAHRLHVITAGRRTSDQTVQLLSSPAMGTLLKELRRRYDHVVIDTPPVLELADAGILGALSDEVLMVVRMNLTPRPLVQQAMRTLGSYNAPVAGLIATDQKRVRRHYQKYEYRYRYRQYLEKAA
jgi:polysaccharide biosynthesis transport protein